MPLFGRRPEPPPAHRSTVNPYLELRQAFLTMGAEYADGNLRGAAYEVGTGGGCATVLCVADGTTSLYLSTGGGRIGLGDHASVREASLAFLESVEAQVDRLRVVDTVPLVGAGEVQVVAVTAAGLRMARAFVAAATDPDSQIRDLCVAGEQVVSRIRLLDELA